AVDVSTLRSLGEGGPPILGRGSRFAHENEIQLHAGPDQCRRLLALEPGHGLPEQLAVELEADAHDVAALLRPEEIAGAAELEIAHRDFETRAELVVLPHRGQPLPGDFD